MTASAPPLVQILVSAEKVMSARRPIPPLFWRIVHRVVQDELSHASSLHFPVLCGSGQGRRPHPWAICPLHGTRTGPEQGIRGHVNNRGVRVFRDMANISRNSQVHGPNNDGMRPGPSDGLSRPSGHAYA